MFIDLGFYKEYYINNKFIGFIKCVKDRESIGYNGKKEEILTIDIFLENNKKIKKETIVTTMIYPLCGKIK